MKVIFAEIVDSLTKVAEGAVLAAAVYLINRGIKHPLHGRKK